MNIFANAMKKLLPQLDTSQKIQKGSRADRINRGYRKMQVFFQRGIDLNPMREVYQKDRSRVFKYPNHDPAVKRPGRYYFRVGDFGHDPSSRRPHPFSRKELIKRGI